MPANTTKKLTNKQIRVIVNEIERRIAAFQLDEYGQMVMSEYDVIEAVLRERFGNGR